MYSLGPRLLYEVVRTNFSVDFMDFRNFSPLFSENCGANWRRKLELCNVPKRAIPSEKKLKAASKSGNKRQRNACSNYATLERTVLRTQSVTNKQTKKQTPHFRIYSRRALYDLPQTLHGDRACRAHQKKCQQFFDPTYSFSYRVYGKIWPNLPTRDFSAITP